MSNNRANSVGPLASVDRYLSKKARKFRRYCNCCYRTSLGALGKPKMVFVWIPKTAGTSLFTALESEVGMVNLYRSNRYVKLFRNRGAVTFGHYDYKALVRAGYVSHDFDREAFKFCVVRDPYDRALSLYYYLKRIDRWVGDFVGFLAEVRDARPRIGLYNSLGLSQTNPQTDWIVDDSGSFIVDEVYRFEDLTRLKEDLHCRFGLSHFHIGHRNQTKRDRSTEAVLRAHDEIIPLIEDIYARDFELLGYETRAMAISNRGEGRS